MRCVNHYEREAVDKCSHCGKDLCAECVVEVNDHTLCKQCVAALAGKPRYGYGHGAHRCYEHSGKPKGQSKFLLFILSAVPGLGYMYLGLIKRGLFVMTTFFITCWLLAEFNITLLAFLIPIIFFASFFDGFRIKRMRDNGEVVTDSVEDFKGFINKHKLPLFGGLAAVILFGCFSNMARSISYIGYHGGYYALHSSLPALILIAIGVYFLVIRKRIARGRHCGVRRHLHGKYREEFDETANPEDRGNQQ